MSGTFALIQSASDGAPIPRTAAAARHTVFCPWPLSKNAGGPSGYLWHLRQGLEEIGGADEIAFSAPPQAGGAKPPAVSQFVKTLSNAAPPLWRALKTYGPSQLRREIDFLCTTPTESMYASGALLRAITNPSCVSIHCHTTQDLLQAHNTLTSLGRRSAVELVLTSHCPEIPALEKVDVMVAQGLRRHEAAAVLPPLLAIDLAAFRNADQIIFPCREALEPYTETCPSFSGSVDEARLAYALTGIVDPNPGDVVADKTGPLTLAYIGRHNSVKGYDLLTAVAPRVLGEDVQMVVAGAPGPLPAPTHPHWRELGRVPGAGALLQRCDLLILPNKRTYFDLVALEALAFGAPILASATGGNKKLAAMSDGVVLFEPSEQGLGAALQDLVSRGKAGLAALGRMNRAAFSRHFTAARFAERYLSVRNL